MDEDFIMRQLKSFAEGFGVMVGKKGSPRTEIVFEQQQNQKGKIYTDLDRLLLHSKYEEAVQYVYAQKFELDKGSYYQLGQWLLEKIKPCADPKLVQELADNMAKYKSGQ